MEFRLLGNLEVVIEGVQVDVGGMRPRTALAMLLVAGGRVVTADAMIDTLWGGHPPESAAGTLQSYVSRLRRALSSGGGRGQGAKVLVWESPGYKLVIDPAALDSHRFEVGADRGRALLAEGDPEQARTGLGEALALWRGPALLGFSHLDFAWAFAAKLEERRIVATEDRIEADLRLGRHAAVVGELGELVAANPLREQFRYHLALALYRSGRQAEALRVLADARSTLRDQLGLDPGRPLADLEAAILAHDPGLTAGLPEPGTTRAVTPASPPEPPALAPEAPLSPPAFVGRDAELHEAVGALDELAAGTRVVVVEGELGIGKTRLVEELSHEAARRGVEVHWGRALRADVPPAFWPWLAPVRALVGELGDGAAVPPELAGLVEAGAAAGAAVPPADSLRFQFFDAVTRLVAGASRRRPLMLVLDDLQWADPPSLELLSFVVGQLSGEPVLVACTVRELEVGRNDAVVGALAELTRARSMRRITLRGISHRATAELVESVAGRSVDPAVTAAIQDRAEGNPFFATELARLVVAEHGRTGVLATVAPGTDVPSGVRDVVRRRLALLPDSTVGLLHVAAVIGRDVDLDLLARAAGRSVADVLEIIDPAVVHRLLVEAPDQPATFRFSHALVRDVVADDVSVLARARTHLRVADALEAAGADEDDTAEIVAEHLWAAAAIGVGQRAAAALERAAEVAVRRYAFESAEGLLERALQLQRSTAGTAATAGTGADAGGEGEASQAVATELRVVSRLLSIQRSLYGYASVVDSSHLRRAKELAARAGRVDVLARLLWTEWAAYDTRCDFARSEAIADTLHELSEGSDDPLVRVTGLGSLGISRWHQGHISEASALLDEAVRLGDKAIPPAMSLGLDLEVLLLPLPFSRYLHVLVGDAGEPGEVEAAFEALASVAPDRFAVSVVETFAAAGALVVGEPEWAERAARRGIGADPAATFTFWGRGLHAYLAAALIDQGHVARGLTMLDEAIEGYLAVGGRISLVLFQASRTAGLIEADRLDDAALALAAARSELEVYGERFAEPLVIEAEARLQLARGGDPREVAATLAPGVQLARTQGAHALARRVEATAARLGLRLPLGP